MGSNESIEERCYRANADVWHRMPLGQTMGSSVNPFRLQPNLIKQTHKPKKQQAGLGSFSLGQTVTNEP